MLKKPTMEEAGAENEDETRIETIEEKHADGSGFVLREKTIRYQSSP
jgi:hypothetical protein